MSEYRRPITYCCWFSRVVSRGRQANEFVKDFHGVVVMVSASLRARHQNQALLQFQETATDRGLSLGYHLKTQPEIATGQTPQSRHDRLTHHQPTPQRRRPPCLQKMRTLRAISEGKFDRSVLVPTFDCPICAKRLPAASAQGRCMICARSITSD